MLPGAIAQCRLCHAVGNGRTRYSKCWAPGSARDWSIEPLYYGSMFGGTSGWKANVYMKSDLTVLIPNMRCGGAERVTSLMVNGLSRRGYRITLMTLAGPEDPFYALDGAVSVVPLGREGEAAQSAGTPGSVLGRVGKIQGVLDRVRPDAVVGIMTECNVLAVLATRIMGRHPCRVLLSEHIHPATTCRRTVAVSARLATFPFADAIVPCSREMAGWYERWLPRPPVVPIQNPAVLGERPYDPEARSMAAEIGRGKWVLSMGRLAEQKGFDRLIDALALVEPDLRRHWTVGIVGDGPLKGRLQRRIEARNLDGEVVFLGRYCDPYPVLRAGEAFVMSSRYEGFPIALTEAMACGLPAVSFDCPTGPSEIIRHDVDGLLVPDGDVEGLAEALERLMSDDRLRRQMAERALEVRERFGLEGFLDRWEELIRQF